MTQFTKIVATIGPATNNPEIIKRLINAGTTTFRFNLKHNSQKWHKQALKSVKEASYALKIKVSTIADLQGPELLTGSFANEQKSITLNLGQKVVMAPANIPSTTHTHIPFEHVAKITNLKKSDAIFLDDGQIVLRTDKIEKNKIYATVATQGILGNNKSVSIPTATINISTLLPKDFEDVAFAIKNHFDFIALSFVRDDKDVIALKKLITKHKGKQQIVSKIETLKAIENFDEILTVSDAIMFARGDLGIEIPIEKLPKLQKQLIKKCREASKPIIVATQMLKSMVDSSIPTRAEVADIANAVFDKTDALMLSEETTIGKLPVKTVQTMSKIARYNENTQVTDDITSKPTSYEEIIITSSIKFTKQHPTSKTQISGYIVFTESGHSARMLSRFRAHLPIYAFTSHKMVANQLTLSYGVVPFALKLASLPTTNIKTAINYLKSQRLATLMDRFIVIFGNNVGVQESNNNLSIITVNK